MTKDELLGIAQYLVDRGIETIDQRSERSGAVIDYVAIFAKDENEFNELLTVLQPLGTEVDRAMLKTGSTFLLAEPLATKAGHLEFIKVRKPDPTRPQRGAPDFVIQGYDAFKQKYVMTSGDFTLMLRPNMEMIELKGVDVLVYIKDRPFSQIIKD